MEILRENIYKKNSLLELEKDSDNRYRIESQKRKT